MDSEALQIRFLDFCAASSSEIRASTDDSLHYILPCCCLEPADDVRILPHQKELVLIVSDTRYTAMLDYVEDSARNGTADRSGCFLAAQLVRGEEVPLPHAGAATDVFTRGELVRLQGLRRANELNGRVGKLLHFHERTGRWHVDVEDQIGVKSLALQNLERVPGSTPHKAFSAWRTSADVGGQWRLAEVGVVMHLDKSEEVRAVKKPGDKPQKARKCTFSAVGRARVTRICNPEAFAEGSKYLLVQAETFEDKRPEHGQDEQESRLLQLLKDVVDLRVSTGSVVSVVPKEKTLEQFSAKCGKDFWNLVTFWDQFLQMQCRAFGLKGRVESLLSRLSDDKELSQKLSERARAAFQSKSHAIDVTDFPPELQKEFQGLQIPDALSYFDRIRIAEAAPLQQLLQSDTHQQRLNILEDALLREKRRLQAPVLEEEVAVLDNYVEPTTGIEGRSASLRSKL